MTKRLGTAKAPYVCNFPFANVRGRYLFSVCSRIANCFAWQVADANAFARANGFPEYGTRMDQKRGLREKVVAEAFVLLSLESII